MAFWSYFAVTVCQCNATAMDLLYSIINTVMLFEVCLIFRDFNYLLIMFPNQQKERVKMWKRYYISYAINTL